MNVRELSLELLGRGPVPIESEAVRRELRDKCIMVTGAAGSIGSELCHQILGYGPRKLVCVDRNEGGLFYLQREVCHRKLGVPLVCCIGDVSDVDGMRRTFSQNKVDHAFHMAAYKHVPMTEENAAEALRNNVFALKDLLGIAEEQSCKSFVLISPDKAVNPTSIMGASKRICELILTARPRNGMRCVSVRFGNVLGSSGSVVKIFEEQLRRGEALTVTHPEIGRFFMTIQEAAASVLQACVIGTTATFWFSTWVRL
jgi:FlaA1/EpsC-like NDP-sugar epimerase